MNNKKAKEIRSIIPYEDAIGRRNYRRAKKIYTRLSHSAKKEFLTYLRNLMQAD